MSPTTMTEGQRWPQRWAYILEAKDVSWERNDPDLKLILSMKFKIWIVALGGQAAKEPEIEITELTNAFTGEFGGWRVEGTRIS